MMNITITRRYLFPRGDRRGAGVFSCFNYLCGALRIICIGMNYVDHCTEQNMPVPTEPVVFSKFSSCITAPGDPIIRAPEVDNLDFEVELAIVVGKTAKRVKEEEAMDYVAG